MAVTQIGSTRHDEPQYRAAALAKKVKPGCDARNNPARGRKQRSEMTVTRLRVLNTTVGASQRPSVVLPLFLISSSPESEIPGYRRRRSRDEPEESGIFHFWKFQALWRTGRKRSRGRAGFRIARETFTAADLVPGGALNFRCGDGPTERLASGG